MQKKEVQSFDLEVDLFAPQPTALAPQERKKGKKALPSAPPPVPQKKVEGMKTLAKCTLLDPSRSRRRTRRTIPSETTPLGVGDWLTDKDILCWLNQELCHMKIHEPRAWALAVVYIKGLSNCMRMVESGTTLGNMAWCRRHIFVVSSDDKEGLHWFVCAFNCHAQLEHFIIWVWNP